eukprot:6184149-Amphidinium_carterae.1
MVGKAIALKVSLGNLLSLCYQIFLRVPPLPVSRTRRHPFQPATLILVNRTILRFARCTSHKWGPAKLTPNTAEFIFEEQLGAFVKHSGNVIRTPRHGARHAQGDMA